MKIEIDEQKILTEILERDGSVHQKIKDTVERNLVDTMVGEIESQYLKNSWRGVTDSIEETVLERIKEKQNEIIKKILSDFYDDYRFGRKESQMLEKLKAFISGEVYPKKRLKKEIKKEI
jgi:hypothetical protein